jgi:hypothetical protein
MPRQQEQDDWGVVTFIGIVVIIIMMAPTLLKIVNEPVDKFSTALSNIDPSASEAVDMAHSGFTNLWDTVIMIAFLTSVILLFLSAFLIDTHPAFLVLYIIVCFLLFLFLPDIYDALYKVWGEFATESAMLPMTEWLLNNLTGVTLAIVILTGIIMYAKIKSSTQGY